MALEAEREEGGNRAEEVYGHERERDPDHRAVLVDLVILRSFGVGVWGCVRKGVIPPKTTTYRRAREIRAEPNIPKKRTPVLAADEPRLYGG